MRRRGLAHRALCLGKAIGQPRHLTFQPVDDLPLRRNGPVQILNGLFLMGHADFKFVNARCIGHDEGNTPADERTQCLVLFCSRVVLTCGSVALRLRGRLWSRREPMSVMSTPEPDWATGEGPPRRSRRAA